MMELWIVGQYISGEPGNVVWHLSGVFDSKDKAVAACRTWEYFVGPVGLNEQAPHEATKWVDVFYPRPRVKNQPPDLTTGEFNRGE